MISGLAGPYRSLPRAAAAAAFVALLAAAPPVRAADDPTLPETPVPLKELPKRTPPLLELGDDFLGTGTLGKGFTLPTGAVWQPSLFAWGVLRSAIHGIWESGTEERSQWANRLDLFGQLSLTPTERVVIGFRPLDQNGRFSGYTFSPDALRGTVNELNAEIDTLYFEGDFGELFPKLDPKDSKGLDYGFGVGRMPVIAQDGMLVGDPIDSAGVVRNTMRPRGTSNLRVTGMFGWGNVHRGGDNVEDPSARLYALFSEVDVRKSQIAFDVAYVDSGEKGDALYAGLSATQRIASERINTVVRVLVSAPAGEDTSAVGSGVLVFGTASITPQSTHDLAYLSLFAAFDNYTPAARAAGTGGPLVNAGILFEGSGVGAWAPVLSNRSKDVLGGALGYQRFWNGARTQLVLEAGAREETEATRSLSGALGCRLQQALGKRFIVRLDTFALAREALELRYGGRAEVLLKF